jgi:hypothetical protein
VLSYAFDGPASGSTNTNWPIEILIDYGKGRVYNATPGHVWAGEGLARKEILFPVPAEFNTAAKVVFRNFTAP